MNVAIVITSTGYGGLELNTLKLAKELEAKGCSIYFVIQENSRIANEVNSNFENYLSLSNVKKYFDFKNGRRVNRYFAKHKISVVLSSYRPDLDLILWVKRRSKRNLKHIHQQHMQIGTSKRGLIQKMRYNAIDEWIAPLEWLKEEVIEKTVMNKDKISVLPISVEIDRFLNNSVTQAEAQKMFNCLTNDTLLGVIGRIDQKKGQLFLVQALEELRNQGENVSLLIVGEPTINDEKVKAYYDELVQYIKVNQLAKYVFLAGFTTNVTEFYKAIDVFVMSSIGETYGMVTLEALLSKKPVIGTNSGGTAELLGFGKYGELYEVDNLTSFCEGYKSLIDRVEKGGLNSDNIQKHVIENYRLEREIDGVYNLIQSHISE